MTYKLNQALLQKLRDGAAIDNGGNPNIGLLRQVLKEAFPEDEPTVSGVDDYYYKHPDDKNLWSSSGDSGSRSIIPLNDFIQKEVLVGYKVKPEFAWCAKKLFEPLSAWDVIADRKCTMLTKSEWDAQAKALGVLDLWFDEVTEEPKEEEPSVDEGIIKLYQRTTRIYNAQEKILRLMIDNKIPVEDMEAIGGKYSK